MADFRTTKKFGSGTSASDGYDVYSPRVDLVDNLVAKDFNDMANSVAETQKALVDGYAYQKLQPAAFGMSVDNEAMVYDLATSKMVKKVVATTSTQQTALDLKANLASPTFTGTVSGITASMVGLGNVDNTSDANKPVSSAQQTALNLKANLASPTFTGTVSGVTASMVGLSNVDNTSDANKPVSSAQQAA